MSKFRWCWIALAFFIGVAGWFFSDKLKTSENFETLSYYGTLATFIALITAILEIMHATSRSKSIHEKATEAITQLNAISSASTTSECLSMLDDVNSNLTEDKFPVALKSFQYFRTHYLKLKTHKNERISMNALFTETEDLLHQSLKTNAANPFGNKNTNNVRKKILEMKANIEKIKAEREE